MNCLFPCSHRMSPPSRPPRRLHLLPNLGSTLCVFAHRDSMLISASIYLGAGNFPTVATPRRYLHGAATYSPDKSIKTGPALAPTDNMASTHSHGGCIPPEAMAATSPAGGRHTADDADVPDNDTEIIGTVKPRPAGGHPHHKPVQG